MTLDQNKVDVLVELLGLVEQQLSFSPYVGGVYFDANEPAQALADLQDRVDFVESVMAKYTMKQELYAEFKVWLEDKIADEQELLAQQNS